MEYLPGGNHVEREIMTHDKVNALCQLISMCVFLALGALFSALTMIYGWGIHPRSWWWIIGVGFFGQAAIQVVVSSIKNSD